MNVSKNSDPDPEETTICHKISLVQWLITNLHIILYLSKCHAIHISVIILFIIMPQLIINTYVSLMYELKKIGRYLRVNLLEPGPRLMKTEFIELRSHKIWATLVYTVDCRPLALDTEHLSFFKFLRHFCCISLQYLKSRESVKNEEALRRVTEERNIKHAINWRKVNWIGHILRRNCLLKHTIEEKARKET